MSGTRPNRSIGALQVGALRYDRSALPPNGSGIVTVNSRGEMGITTQIDLSTGSLQAAEANIPILKVSDITAASVTTTKLEAANITITGTTGFDQLTVTGDADITGSLRVGNVDVSGGLETNTLAVAGEANFDDQITVGGPALFNNGATISSGGLVVVGGGASITGNVDVSGGTLTVPLIVSGTGQFTGLLNAGEVKVGKNIDVSGAFQVDQTSTFRGPAIFETTAIFKENIEIWGNIRDVDVQQTEYIHIYKAFATQLHAGGATTTHDFAGNALDVSGSAKISNGLTVTAGDFVISTGRLNVEAGGASITGGVTIKGSLDVSNNLIVNNGTHIKRGLTIDGSGAVIADGISVLNGGGTVVGELSVYGDTTINGALDVSSGLVVRDLFTAASGASITGGVTITGPLDVSSGLVARDLFTAARGASITGGVTITGSLDVSSGLVARDLFTAARGASITGGVTLTNGNINISSGRINMSKTNGIIDTALVQTNRIQLDVPGGRGDIGDETFNYPSIYWNEGGNRWNTGINHPDYDQISILTGGATRMHVTNSGVTITGLLMTQGGANISSFATINGTLSSTGNITSLSAISAPFVSGATVTGTTVTATGNMEAGGNVSGVTVTGTTVTATGNIEAGGNVSAANIELTTNGTTSITAIHWSDDTNTGINHSVDTISIITGGAPRMHITNSGVTVDGNLTVTGSITNNNIIRSASFITADVQDEPGVSFHTYRVSTSNNKYIVQYSIMGGGGGGGCSLTADFQPSIDNILTQSGQFYAGGGGGGSGYAVEGSFIVNGGDNLYIKVGKGGKGGGNNNYTAIADDDQNGNNGQSGGNSIIYNYGSETYDGYLYDDTLTSTKITALAYGGLGGKSSANLNNSGFGGSGGYGGGAGGITGEGIPVYNNNNTWTNSLGSLLYCLIPLNGKGEYDNTFRNGKKGIGLNGGSGGGVGGGVGGANGIVSDGGIYMPGGGGGGGIGGGKGGNAGFPGGNATQSGAGGGGAGGNPYLANPYFGEPNFPYSGGNGKDGYVKLTFIPI
jgi:hypothetical protein